MEKDPEHGLIAHIHCAMMSLSTIASQSQCSATNQKREATYLGQNATKRTQNAIKEPKAKPIHSKRIRNAIQNATQRDETRRDGKNAKRSIYAYPKTRQDAKQRNGSNQEPQESKRIRKNEGTNATQRMQNETRRIRNPTQRNEAKPKINELIQKSQRKAPTNLKCNAM